MQASLRTWNTPPPPQKKEKKGKNKLTIYQPWLRINHPLINLIVYLL
jgi:hypothetical protein